MKKNRYFIEYQKRFIEINNTNGEVTTNLLLLNNIPSYWLLPISVTILLKSTIW